MTREQIAASFACLWLFVGYAPAAHAQTVVGSFGELKGTVKPGQTVSVTDETGRRIKGKLADLSPSSITLVTAGGRETFQDAQVRELTQPRRYTRRGSLWGLVAGAGFGLILGTSCTDSCGPGLPLVAAVSLGGVGAGIGAAVGATISGERLVYRAAPPHASPSTPLGSVKRKIF